MTHNPLPIMELPKIYDPHAVEDRLIATWIDKKLSSISPYDSSRLPYCIVIPPPNVTGSLHMGHALNSTLQDILIRYHRMKGNPTLWVVGTDHAGIATQNVVERKLQAEGKTRFDLGREKFIERVWEWKKESGKTIINQLKRLGASCDYEHERFTMDEGLSLAVRKVFVHFYEEGLIYRDKRLINWCPRCHTALSDLEVEHKEQKGSLWHIKYQIQNPKSEIQKDHPFLIIATTRPETLLGDTAVAVHPEDKRYKNWIGQSVKLPLTNREIPIIADLYVDREFGSGVVKITPAHDFNDFEIGKRHHLEQINILTEDGKINEKGGTYQGFTVAEARKQILVDLQKQELFENEETYTHAVGHCYRCKTVVEPYLSYQWFVKTKPLAEPAIEAVKSGKTRFVPKHWEKTYFNWMENIQDWCISRQIWWGHQIPAWYCCKSSTIPSKCPPIVSEVPPKSCPTCGSTQLTQDPDVLDTWFSSALWPFSTLGWPANTPELKTFYPTSVLITAFDIIFFWVARMMMMGLHFMKQVPFRHVHIHALVRDPLGQKMSKSKGNVVDPLLMMKKYGTDAFRFTLSALAAKGRDIKLDCARIEGYRNFCNKIWNASRFALMSAKPFIRSQKDFESVDPKNRINQWILYELNKTIATVTHSIENYEFNLAANFIYTFFWHDFCDWYLEFTKEIFREGDHKIETALTIYHVLDVSLRLLHPFMPFITEELWQMLGERGEASIVKAKFPTPSSSAEKFQSSWEEIQLLIQSIGAIRSIRQETGLALSTELPVWILTPKENHSLYEDIKPMLSNLARVCSLTYLKEEPKKPCAVSQVGDATLYVPLEGLIDIQKECERQTKKLEKLKKNIHQLKTKLDDPRFIENALLDLVEEKKMELKGALTQKLLIEKTLHGYQK